MPQEPKLNVYITKFEALCAIRDVKTGRKEDIEWAVRSIPGVKVFRSKKLSKVYVDKSGEEVCPHCHKHLRFYDVVSPPPKYCYCMWCGGALERKKGNRNGWFDYSLIKDKPPVIDEYAVLPTDGQIRFTRAIAQRLKIPLPERTKTGYGNFIRKYKYWFYHPEEWEKVRDNEEWQNGSTAETETPNPIRPLHSFLPNNSNMNLN